MSLANRYPAIRCSRCNRKRESKCKNYLGCDFDIYRAAIIRQFPVRPPTKYYCTISGAANAGKTYYLVTLLFFLMKDMTVKKILYKYGIKDIIFADPISKKYHNDLLNDCKDGGLKLTSPAEPLKFFNLIIFRDGSKDPIELVLFNSSGERFEDPTISGDLTKKEHDLCGAAILHFVDPREDSKLHDILLKPKIIQCKNLDIIDFLYRLVQINNYGIQYIEMPLGICVSKFDLLSHKIPNPLPEDIYVSILSRKLFKDIDYSSRILKEFLSLHSTTIEPDILSRRYYPEKLRYFGVAAFGNDQTPARWENRTPKGVLAPFLWMLRELQIIPRKK